MLIGHSHQGALRDILGPGAQLALRKDLPLPESPPLQYFEGLSWAVPTAFASAVSAFRFEQGDLLFRDGSAYDAWAQGASYEGPAIQVLLPPRSARATPHTGDGDRKQQRWESEVVVEWFDSDRAKPQPRTLTQGRLFAFLWTGDTDWLDSAGPEPTPPAGARELAQQLDQAKDALGAALKLAGGVRFSFVVDLSSDASRVKAGRIFEGLSSLGALETVDLTSQRAGVAEAGSFHPALVIRSLAIAGASEAAVEGALKAALYLGNASATEGDPGEAVSDPEAAAFGGEADAAGTPRADRFSVARHGLLEVIGS